MKLNKIQDLIKDYNISDITDDSRQLKSFSIFTAYKGENFDRRDLIANIISNNELSNLIIFKDTENIKLHEVINSLNQEKKIIVINYYNLKENLGFIAKVFYKNHDQNFNISAVTGTNGKTSIVYLLTKSLELLGHNSGSIGTLGVNHNNQAVINTTPGAIALQKILANFHKEGVVNINMEASSHALVQNRLSGVIFNRVIFTNLTPEHLDYHNDMEDYFNAKLKLFKKPYINNESIIIINHDEPSGIRILKYITKEHYKNKIVSYGSLNGVIELNKICKELALLEYSYIAFDNNNDIIFSEIEGQKYKLKTNLIGKFNLYNILAVIADLYSRGFPVDSILGSIKKIQAIPGRMQQVESNKAKIYIDYAHTSDALENILKELKNLKTHNPKQKLICVFGCGGDRDKLKRPQMGKIAVRYSDTVIITDDNPRTESPELIIQDIVNGLTNEEYSKISINHNRHEAIKDALRIANADDIIIIAGKGHEEYQIYGKERFYFSDFEAVRSLLD